MEHWHLLNNFFFVVLLVFRLNDVYEVMSCAFAVCRRDEMQMIKMKENRRIEQAGKHGHFAQMRFFVRFVSTSRSRH